MHDARSMTWLDLKVRANRLECIHEGTMLVSRCRVRHDPRRLIEHDNIVILIDDWDREILWLKIAGWCDWWQIHLQAITITDSLSRLARLTVDEDLPRFIICCTKLRLIPVTRLAMSLSSRSPCSRSEICRTRRIASTGRVFIASAAPRQPVPSGSSRPVLRLPLARRAGRSAGALQP